MTGPRVNEHRPLLLSPKARDVAITIHGDDDDNDDLAYAGGESPSANPSVFRYMSFRASPSSSLASVSPKYYQQHADQQQQAPLLSRKYVTYPVEDVVRQKRSRTKVAAAVYGTMSVKTSGEEMNADEDDKHSKTTTTTLRSLLCKLDDPRKTKQSSSTETAHTTDGHCNNQSETESDSDGSCGSNTASNSSIGSSSSLQSILRIRDGLYACQKVRKQMSVEFLLDVDHDDKDNDDERRKSASSNGLLCASNCMPRYVEHCSSNAVYKEEAH